MARPWQIKVKWWCWRWWWWTDLWNGRGWPTYLVRFISPRDHCQRLTTFSSFSSFTDWHHSFSTYVKFSEKKTSLRCAYVCVYVYKRNSHMIDDFCSIVGYLVTLHKKWSFPLHISSLNKTKSAGNCGFGQIYWKNLSWKTSFFVQC